MVLWHLLLPSSPSLGLVLCPYFSHPTPPRRLLNALPANRVTATAVDGLLRAASFRMVQAFRGQFMKLLSYIDAQYLPELATSHDPDARAVYTRIQVCWNWVALTGWSLCSPATPSQAAPGRLPSDWLQQECSPWLSLPPADIP